jgi:hypothetical protein
MTNKKLKFGFCFICIFGRYIKNLKIKLFFADIPPYKKLNFFNDSLYRKFYYYYIYNNNNI